MKRAVVLALAIILCFGCYSMGEETLTGSWERVATVINGVIYENDGAAKELWVFRPDGTWQLYTGSVIDYSFTDDKITVSYEDSFSKLIGYESRVLTKEYSYILDNDMLVLIYNVNERSIYMVHQRESGEGLFGRWNQIATLYSEEAYQAWQNSSKLTEEPVLEIIDFYADDKCVFWQGIISADDDWDEIPDLIFRYAVSGESLTLTMGNGVYEVGYTFEDGSLVLTFPGSYFGVEEWVKSEVKLILSHVQ